MNYAEIIITVRELDTGKLTTITMPKTALSTFDLKEGSAVNVRVDRSGFSSTTSARPFEMKGVAVWDGTGPVVTMVTKENGDEPDAQG
jgi:hypothetical protein